MDKLRGLGRLYRLYAHMDLSWFLQDTRTCIIVIFSEWIASIAGISGVLLLSIRFGGVGGLSTDEMLFLLSLSMLGDGVMALCFSGFNVSHISRRLGRGQLDHMLIQPVPLWMQLLAEGFLPVTSNSQLLCGIGLMAFTLPKLSLSLNLGWWLLLLGFLLVRVVLSLSLSYLVGISAIWQPVASEEVSSIMLELCNSLAPYPLIGLPAPLMLVLETVLPIALLVYLPALTLLGKAGGFLTLVWPFILSALFAAAATFAFRKGLKHYAKVGSRRYRNMGFRN